jgi:hypothetical protein
VVIGSTRQGNQAIPTLDKAEQTMAISLRACALLLAPHQAKHSTSSSARLRQYAGHDKIKTPDRVN